MRYWINPLTGDDSVPTNPGDILNAAIAYWEDVVMETRSKRPRKPADKTKKLETIEHAVSRLDRYRAARAAFNPKKYNHLTVQLATDDLSAVMRTTKERAA